MKMRAKELTVPEPFPPEEKGLKVIATVCYSPKTKGLALMHRTMEELPIGSTAYVCWGKGRRPWRVTVLERHDRHYSVDHQSGIYGLYLDEVRSTPEAAKRNYVTG